MAFDPPQASARLPQPQAPQPQAPQPTRTKVRIRFRKAADLRLVSHHDLMKCLERMLRRAALPVALSRGFHPKPRMVFALSLALGIVGCQEVLELEFVRPLSAETIHDALAQQAPPGLDILSVKPIDPKDSAQPTRVCYRLDVPPERCTGLPERIQSILSSTEGWVVRRRPPERRIDIRPYLRDLRLSAAGLEIDLWVTPSGMARPEEILQLLELEDLLDAGAIFERTLLELCDETHEPGSPNERQAIRSPQPAPHLKRQGPVALVPGPMSFDS